MRALPARARFLGAMAAITLALAGCSPIQDVTSPLVPGSQWHVLSVDDESTVGLELILTFIGTSATLSSRCGASSGEVSVDAEGQEVRFGPMAGPGGDPICPDSALELHRRVAEALQGVERWEAAGASTELHGERIIRLQKQATDT